MFERGCRTVMDHSLPLEFLHLRSTSSRRMPTRERPAAQSSRIALVVSGGCLLPPPFALAGAAVGRDGAVGFAYCSKSESSDIGTCVDIGLAGWWSLPTIVRLADGRRRVLRSKRLWWSQLP